jgi:hypothetical protein
LCGPYFPLLKKYSCLYSVGTLRRKYSFISLPEQRQKLTYFVFICDISRAIFDVI